jgi:glycogen operon protein
MIGNDNTVTHLATRIAGSSDLYEASGRGPLCSINFITSHDGFTLADLVSYDRKNNLANGENDRDGEKHNLSWNSGYEGSCQDEEIIGLRLRRMKTFAVILLLSQGVPMIAAGDEFGRSQKGNNNAWCQDNSLSWLDWSLLAKNAGFFRFFKECLALRKRHKIFRREDFFLPLEQTAQQGGQPEIQWQYLAPQQQNWSPDNHGLAFYLRAPDQDLAGGDFFVMLNGDREETLHFEAPPPQRTGHSWYRIIDSAAVSPMDFVPVEDAKRQPESARYSLSPFACKVLQSAA